jgi:hypothetical protein
MGNTHLFDNAGIACLTHTILLADRVLEKMNHKLLTLRDTKALRVSLEMLPPFLCRI